jgi:hypothetical protein
LPSHYFAPLLGRGTQGVARRVAELRGKPYYVALAEQPHNNYRPFIYQLAKAGAEEVRESGYDAKLRSRPVAHELMACLIAASFEIGAKKHAIPITLASAPAIDLPIEPDWPPFILEGRTVFIEADMGTETINADAESQATNIRDKFERYLHVIHQKAVRRPLFLFVTTRKSRRDAFVELLKRVIDRNGYPYAYAERFGFASIEYDRFLNEIPKPSGWAVTVGYLRAGHEPFSFVPTNKQSASQRAA